MATIDRPDEPADPASDVAGACRDADLVCVVGARRGEALAAVGLLGRALAAVGVPFQARLTPAGAVETDGATDADVTIAVCRPDLSADHAVGSTIEGSAAGRAYRIASELADPDPALGLAGALVAGREPSGRLHEDARTAGCERQPGVAVPTTDFADGLAHSTLVHAPFSGDLDATADALAEMDLSTEPTADDRRRVASLVALAVAEREDCPPQATRAVERVLHPWIGGPFETVGGYADVLDALARTRPGLGIAVALGAADPEDVLAPWREYGLAVHRAVASAECARHDGLVIAHAQDVDDTATLATVARLVRDFRSPEPTVLAGCDDGVVLTTVDEELDVVALLEDATPAETAVAGDADVAIAPVAADEEALRKSIRRASR